MKKIVFVIPLLCIGCSHNNGSEEAVGEDVNIVSATLEPQYNANQSDNSSPSSNSNVVSSYDGRDNGYKNGYDMGYIAGREGYEYNPNLPVGPNVRTYSFEYRQGYASGYSAGYDKGRQANRQGGYADDDSDDIIILESDDDFEYYEE